MVLAALGLAGCGSSPSLHRSTLPSTAASAGSSSALNASGPSSLAGIVAQLGGRPCPEAPEFLCVSTTMPLDHRNPGGKTIQFRFAVRPATGRRLGSLLVAEGGPGAPGIDTVSIYTAAVPAIASDFDVIAYDLRGVAGSSGVDCPAAKGRLESDGRSTDTPLERQSLLQRAQRFGHECAAEARISPEDLRHYNTLQATYDLERIRHLLRIPKLTLYGESYGSQVVQTYANQFPERVERMVLDGVVDLEPDLRTFNEQVVHSANKVLQSVLAYCKTNPGCSQEFEGSPSAAFDRIVDRVSRGPIAYDFPMPSGQKEHRTFSRTQLDMASVDSLQYPSGRSLWLRALAYADRSNDFVPFARLAYKATSVNPVTRAFKDGLDSSAMYHAFICNDYGRGGATGEEAFNLWIQRGERLKQSGARLLSGLYLDISCAFWPSAEDHPRPAIHGPAEHIPTLLLTARGDTLTPMDQALSVLARHEKASAVVATGGQHVMFARQVGCVDNHVVDFLTKGSLPSQRVVTCESPLVTAYAPIPTPVSVRRSDAENVRTVERESFLLPELEDWDHRTDLSLGCGREGSVTFTATGETQTRVRFVNCSFVPGVAVSGVGTATVDGKRFEGDLVVNGSGAPRKYERKAGRYSLKP